MSCLINCVTCDVTMLHESYPCPVTCGDNPNVECSKGVVHVFEAVFRVSNGTVIERWTVYAWTIPRKPNTCEEERLSYICTHTQLRGSTWIVSHTESFLCDWSDVYHRFFPVFGTSCFDEDGLNAWEYIQYKLDVDPIWMRTHQCPGNMVLNTLNECECPPGYIEVDSPPCCDDDDDIPPPPPGTPMPPPPKGFKPSPNGDGYEPLDNDMLYEWCVGDVGILLADCSDALESNDEDMVRVKPSSIIRSGGWPQYDTPEGIMVATCGGPVILSLANATFNDIPQWPDYVVWSVEDWSYTCNDPGPVPPSCGPNWVGYWAHPSTDGNVYKWKFSFRNYVSCQAPKGPDMPWIPVSPPVQV